MLPRLILAALLLFPATLLRAHHSAAAEFDSSKPVVLHGKVTKVAWMNPHVHFWVDVADASGKVTNWELESVAPNYLQRLGWTKQSLKAGDTVTVEAFRAKDQPNLAKTDVVTLPNGKRVTTGRADDGAHNPSPR
ncbi:MAG TPA: DUF6152 family protein [Bryobacteraceae bacterium]|jgi:hypothetical protein